MKAVSISKGHTINRGDAAIDGAYLSITFQYLDSFGRFINGRLIVLDKFWSL